MEERTAALRALLAAERHGVLSTLAVRRAGWPFASITPYALTATGEPILLLSDLAEHTRNVRADPRASLFVQDSASREDPQAGARLTLLGQVDPHGRDAEVEARYVERHPSAKELLQMADFRFYILRLSEARYVGGFGDMGWIDARMLLIT